MLAMACSSCLSIRATLSTTSSSNITALNWQDLRRIGIESALIIVKNGARLVGMLLFMREVWQVGIHGKFKHAIAFLLSRV